MKKGKPSTALQKPPEAKERCTLAVKLAPGQTIERARADLITSGLAANAGLAGMYAEQQHGDVSLTELVASLREAGAEVNKGDLAASERMLTAQSASLNSIYVGLALKAGAHMGANLECAERLLRLALKAQGQCRATLETLAAIKNPPVVFAKQANINTGGQQQVNNGQLAHSRTGDVDLGPNRLFESSVHAST